MYFDINLNTYLKKKKKKKTKYWPKPNPKLLPGEGRLCNEKLKKAHTYTHTHNSKTHIYKIKRIIKKPLTLIKVIRKNKNPPKERWIFEDGSWRDIDIYRDV